MSDKKMWFGRSWVKCPAIDAATSPVGWSTGGQYLNGLAYQVNSSASHMTYDFTWNLDTQENIRAVTDYAEGYWGTSPICFVLPGTEKTNIASSLSSAPGVFEGADHPLFPGWAYTQKLDTTPNQYGTPHMVAHLTRGSGDTAKPTSHLAHFGVPDGWTARVDVFGYATPYNSGDHVEFTVGGVDQYLPSSLGHIVFYQENVTAGSSWLDMTASGSVSETDVFVYGVRIRVAPTKAELQQLDTVWMSGRGHNGCRFAGRPTFNTYSARLDKYGASATLVEVG